MSYESYCMDMKKFNQVPMSKVDFNIMQGTSDDIQPPLVISPKRNDRMMAASLENFIKIAESSKRRRPSRIQETLPKKIRAERPPKMSEEEKIAKRKLYVQQKKVKYKAMGLTSKGKAPKSRPVGMNAKEMREYKAAKMREQRAIWKEQGLNWMGKPFKKPSKEKLLEYAKRYQANHREKHLEARRKWREKSKEKKNMCILQEAS